MDQPTLKERSRHPEQAGTNQSEPPAPRRGRLLPGCAAFAVIGCAALVYIQGSGLASPFKYHTDLTQSPHWIAYHVSGFAEDDLLVEYGRFNETPIQNAIYWLGTWLVDVVLLNKLVGIAIFGVTAALFFGLTAPSSGALTAVLAAALFVVFPRSTYEIAGGFSKAWAIGLVLLAVHAVESRSWRLLVWVLPLAALAYPIAAVLIGAIVLVGVLLELPRDRREGITGFKRLLDGSVLALMLLLLKYLNPPARIGEMVSTETLKALWSTNYTAPFLLPLWQELSSYLERPFIYGAAILLVVLIRRGMVWKRSWSALLIASSLGYYVAAFVAPRLYVPDRYTRFSMAVLLVLFFAHNGARALELIRAGWMRWTAALAVIALAVLCFEQTFRPCTGKKSHGVWENKEIYAGLSAAVAALPQPVLVAGHPIHTAEVLVQAKRPVFGD